MLRAGLIKRLAGGIYVDAGRPARLEKVENIVREMNRAGAVELFMPAVVPAGCGRKPAAGKNTARNCCVSGIATSATS